MIEIERVNRLQIHGNVVDDSNVECSLEELKDKINELVDRVNFLTQLTESLRHTNKLKGV